MPHPHFKASSLRPSPSMAVAVTAMFFALAGAGYAASAIPNNSVGNRQLQKNAVANVNLRNNSVGFAKMRHSAVHYFNIAPHSVGIVRIVPSQVQLRVKGTCTSATANGAISTVNQDGTVVCSTAGAEFNSPVATTATAIPNPVSGKALPAGSSLALFSLDKGSSYLVQADPYITVTPEKTANGPVVSGKATPQTEAVDVSCTLTVGSGSTATTLTRQAPTIDVTQGGAPEFASFPMTMAVPTSASSQPATLTCMQTDVPANTTAGETGTLPAIDPAVTAQGTIYALATSSNTSAAATPAIRK